jgi:hypothetical protein
VNDLPQERIKPTQDWICLWLAVCKPLVETVHMFYVLFFVHNVVDASAGSSEETDPHPGRTVREMSVCGGRYDGANSKERADGIFPVHRQAAVDGFLAAFNVPRFIERDVHILQAATLKKCSGGMANAC